MSINKRFHQDILYYQIENYNQDEYMNHIFSTRIGWVQDELFENLGDVLRIPKERIYRAKQVHGTDVAVINQDNVLNSSLGEKDGLVTNVKGMALSTYHADCVPIYFYDSVKLVIGLAHAGWKGTLNNINKVVLEKMVKNFDCNIQDIKVGIGPSIGPCCYEIGEDVEKLFKVQYPDDMDIIKRVNGKMYLDLWKVNKKNLLEAGIVNKNIFLSGYCTSCNVGELYSYRKEKGTKNRMIAAIILNP